MSSGGSIARFAAGSQMAIASFGARMASVVKRQCTSRVMASHAKPSSLRLVVVGDIHGSWNKDADERALRFLKPDLVLFTGDFENEDVELAGEVSKLDMPKAAILGNHDCWWFALPQYNPNIRLKSGLISDGETVKRQLEALGDSHVGFGRKDFPDLKLSVIGGRPFSIGGARIFNPVHCASIYNVRDLEESAQRILSCAMLAPKDHSLIFLGHNGPTGLGSQVDDICGKDFDKEGGGDYGDPDFEQAIERARAFYNIPLVTFGHMHNELMYMRGQRKMLKDGGNGTIYVNAAVVPRERFDAQDRNFTLVELEEGKVRKVAQLWVRVPEQEEGIVELAQESLFY